MSLGLKELDEHNRKDGLTVKKLIALLLVAGFICATTVGCGDSKTTPAAKPTTAAPAK